MVGDAFLPSDLAVDTRRTPPAWPGGSGRGAVWQLAHGVCGLWATGSICGKPVGLERIEAVTEYAGVPPPGNSRLVSMRVTDRLAAGP